MPTSSAASSAQPFRGARLISHSRARRSRARPHPFASWALLAFALAVMPAAARADAPSMESVAKAVRASAGGDVKKFYRTRGFWPLWVHKGKIGPEADAFIALLASADLDGLKPDRYDPDKLRDLVKAASEEGTPEALAKAELKLSRTLADYIADVRRAPSVKITYLDKELEPRKLDEAEILRLAALAPSFADYVGQGGWMSPLYMKLRAALGEFDAKWDKLPNVDIPPGALLRTGDKGNRVRLLRQRLGLPDGAVFDKALAKKLRAFQADHGLAADGIAGEKVIAALDRGPHYYERIIRLNLERARVLPGPWTRHIVVDAASARLWAYDDGKVEQTMRVVVGKASEQTPMLAGMVRYAILNPYWNVPYDLVQDRIAPKVLKGQSLHAMGYEALSDWGANATVLEPGTIDWTAVAAGRAEPRVRQLPGPDNAMGKMKFMFPNNLGIYLHDTPSRDLFTKTVRHFSSGCVRLEHAAQLGKWLFGKPLKAQSDAPEQNVALPKAVPVYLTYLTVQPTDKGITFLDDDYGRDGTADAEKLARR